MSDTIPIQNEHVAYTTIDDQAVLIHPDDSSMYWLNPVASHIWSLADGEHTAREIADLLCVEYQVEPETALKDTKEMIRAFVEKRLLIAM